MKFICQETLESKKAMQRVRKYRQNIQLTKVAQTIYFKCLQISKKTDDFNTTGNTFEQLFTKEDIQMVNTHMDEVYPYNGVLYSNENKHLTATCKNMYKSHKYNAE